MGKKRKAGPAHGGPRKDRTPQEILDELSSKFGLNLPPCDQAQVDAFRACVTTSEDRESKNRLRQSVVQPLCAMRHDVWSRLLLPHHNCKYSVFLHTRAQEIFPGRSFGTTSRPKRAQTKREIFGPHHHHCPTS